MASLSSSGLHDDLRTYQLLGEAELRTVESVLLPQFPDPRDLARELVRRGWLTPFQVNRLIQGRAGELILGPYTLLDRLGGGGMGEVFKARHRLMDRLAALKVIRSERLGGRDNLERFRREIQAAAKLSHPNVVMAFDANEAGGILFLVMEYLDGADLGRLVKQRGPLPLAEACHFARQAALGLQHAAEHGLVHRDVKPSNLMVTGGGAVKVLDLGLARLRASAEGPRGDLTQQGVVMGTPDYIAPEQIDDAARADTRADVYSLGCTLYQLLTGSVPFPAGSILEKLNGHKGHEPAPVPSLRADVPAALVGIVGTMMAKDPARRYQTFAEVAEALAPFAAAGPFPSPAVGPPPSQAETLDFRRPQPVTVGFPATTASLHSERPQRRLPWWLPWAGGAAAGLLVLMLLVLNWPGGAAVPADPNGRQVKNEKPDPLAPAKKQEVDQVKEKEPPPLPPNPIRDLPQGKVRRFLGHTSGVGHVAPLDGGRKILSVATAEVMIWDANDDRLELKKYQPLSLSVAALYPDETRMLLARQGSEQLFVLNLASGATEKPFGTARAVHSLAVAPDGSRALSAGFDGLTRLWDLSKRAEIRRFEGRTARFARDGKHVLTMQHSTGGARLNWYRTEDGEMIRQFDEVRGGMTCVALSGDSTLALTGDGGKCLRFWEMATGKELRKIEAAHGSEILAVAFAPDGRRALSGGRDRAVKLWEVATGRELRKWYGNNGSVTCVAFTPDGRYALSGSDDQTVRLWALPE